MSFILIALVFVLDIFVFPLGVAGGVPYVLAFLVSTDGSSVRSTFTIAVLLSVLVYLGYVWAPATLAIANWVIVTNRLFALVAIWTGFGITSQRLRNARAATAANKLALSVIQAIPDLVLIVDRENKVRQTFVSQSPLAELAANHWRGRSIRDGLPQDCAVSVEKACERTRSTNAAAEWCGAIDVHQQRRYTEWRVVPFSEHDVVLVVRDITDQHNLRSENRKYEKHLIHLQRIQTLDSLQTKVAHELAQPLTAITTYAESLYGSLIRGRVDYDELVDSLRRIIDASEHGRKLLDSLRRRVRKHEHAFETSNLNEIVRHVVHLLDVERLQPDVTCCLQLDEDLPEIRCHAIQIEQVTVNLVENALESLRQRSDSDRKLVLTTERSGSFATLSIHDNGVGLPRGCEKTVFEPFFTTRKEGIGMGLAICCAIVEGHGGRIHAVSNETGGATFRVELPIASHQPVE